MRERLFDVGCGLMIMAGSIVFLNGGRQHPATDPRRLAVVSTHVGHSASGEVESMDNDG